MNSNQMTPGLPISSAVEAQLRKASLYLSKGYITGHALCHLMAEEMKSKTFETENNALFVHSQADALAALKAKKLPNPLLIGIIESALVAAGNAHIPGGYKWEAPQGSTTTTKRLYSQAAGIWTKTMAATISEAMGKKDLFLVQRKAKHPSPAGLQALLDHHVNVGYVALIKGDLMPIDPVIGDASCQMRCPFLLHMHAVVQKHLQSASAKQHAIDLAVKFDALHKGKEYEKVALEPKDIQEGSKEFKALIKDLSEVTKKEFLDAPEYLGLCVTLSLCCQWRIDDFGSPYHFRDMSTFYTLANPSNPDEPIDQKKVYKPRLGVLSCAYMKAMASKLPSNKGKVGAPKTVGDMIAFVFAECEARTSQPVPKKGTVVKVQVDETMPVLPIYASFRAILMSEFEARRPINLIVRRIKLVKASSPTDSAYSLSDAQTLHFVPIGDTGKYAYQAQPHDAAAPSFTVSAFSVFDGSISQKAATHGAEDLFSNDSNVYFKCLQKCDLGTLLMIYAAGHPAFQTKALYPISSSASVNVLAGMHYQHFLHFSAQPGISDPIAVARMDSGLCVDLMDATQTTLANEWDDFYKIASDYALTDAQQCVRETREIAVRINRAVCFAGEHVLVQSYAQSVAECERLKVRCGTKSFPQVFKIPD